MQLSNSLSPLDSSIHRLSAGTMLSLFKINKQPNIEPKSFFLKKAHSQHPNVNSDKKWQGCILITARLKMLLCLKGMRPKKCHYNTREVQHVLRMLICHTMYLITYSSISSRVHAYTCIRICMSYTWCLHTGKHTCQVWYDT
jgi:hypothetical protein